ncbi:MAG: hypothetical protein PHV68_08235, partial [Candidatus Gastranaerophilales bacterium]|nr:hypothetical protein [Candidatus Gastranaerophilales bacterium]
MSDLIEKYNNSIIQHGKENNRVYLIKLDSFSPAKTVDYIMNLALKNSYSKIFAKIPSKFKELFYNNVFIKEAFIFQFYKGKEDCLFLAKYLTEERKEFHNK